VSFNSGTNMAEKLNRTWEAVGKQADLAA